MKNLYKGDNRKRGANFLNWCNFYVKLSQWCIFYLFLDIVNCACQCEKINKIMKR